MSSMGIFSRIAAKILDVDRTSLPEQQFAMIQDMLANQRVQIKGKEAKDLLTCLKRKHYVNSITLLRNKDGVVFSSSGNGNAESRSGADLLSFANRNFAKTDVVTMRTEKEWVMLMPSDHGLYVIKANSSLSPIELRAVAKDVETILKKRRFS